MNVKNLLAGIGAAVLALGVMVNVNVVSASIVDPEFDAALNWGYDAGLTKYNSQDAFMPFASITREQFAKFGAAYGVTNLCLEPDTSASCAFSDIPADPSLDEYVALACQLGLVKGSNGKFFPTSNLTRAEALTVLSRAVAAAEGEDAPSEDVTPWWKNHFEAMRTLGVTKETDVNAQDRPISRYEILLMLYRARVTDSECSDIDLGDLLDDLFNNKDDDDEEEVPGDVGESDADVEADLSPDTADGSDIPGNAVINVGSFVFEAEGDDAVLTSLILKRFGLSNNSVIQNITLFVNGEPVSKPRSPNADGEVYFALSNPRVNLPAGEPVTVDVYAKVGPSSSNAGATFRVALVDFETNGTDQKSDLPIHANEFRIAGVDAAKVIVEEDGNLSNLELGARGEVAKFEMENDSNTSDIYITRVTLKDDENNADDVLANLQLIHNGNVLASTSAANGRYVTFNLTTPFRIQKNRTEEFVVLADVVAGAGESVDFQIDQPIYVLGYDASNEFGLDVDVSGYSSQAFAITAGDVTLIKKNLSPKSVRSEREEFTLAAFDVDIKAGQDLVLQDINFRVHDDADSAFPVGGQSLLDRFEAGSFELIVTFGENSRQVYNLETDETNANSFFVGDEDLDIYLPNSGPITVSLVADTVDEFLGTVEQTFRVELNVATNLVMIESGDDEEVTNIVPSFQAYDVLTFVDPEVFINSINLSNITVVVGAQNVDATMFEVEADDVSDVYVEGFTFCGSGSVDVNNQVISALRLWKQTTSGWELVDEEGGSKISDECITFDNFNEVIVPASESQIFLFTVDVVENESLATKSVKFWLDGADIEDDAGYTLTPTPSTADSTRVIYLSDGGDLDISVNTSDDEVNSAQFVLGGQTRAQAPFVASFEFVADDEGAIIEDLIFTATGAGSGQFGDAFSELVIYDDDMVTVLGSRTVTNNTSVTFNNINLEIPEGETTVFVKLVAKRIGNNYEGISTDDMALILAVANVDGSSSGVEITPNYDGTGMTLPSNLFRVVEAKFADAEFVAPGTTVNGVVVNPTTTNGTDINIGILRLTADSWTNTENIGGGGALEILVNQLAFTVSNTSDLSGFELRRIGNGGSTSYISGTVAGNVVTFDISGADVNTREFVSGEVGYYQIRADISATGNTTVSLALDDLTNPSCAFDTDDAVTYQTSDNLSNYCELRIENNLVESQSITVNNS